MNISLKTLFAAAIALSFTACSTDTSKTTNADGSTTTTAVVTTPGADSVGAKMDAKMDAAGDKMDATGNQIDAKMDAAGDKTQANTAEAKANMNAKMDAAGNKMDAMGDAAAKSARETKANMKAAAKQ